MTIEKTLKRNLERIESQIKQYQLDLSIHIERESSQFKGTIAKNQNSFELALKRFMTIEQAKQKVQKWLVELN